MTGELSGQWLMLAEVHRIEMGKLHFLHSSKNPSLQF